MCAADRCSKGAARNLLRTVGNQTASTNENLDVCDVSVLLVCEKRVLMVLVLVSVSSQNDPVLVSNRCCGF